MTDKPDLRILPDGLGSRGTVKRAELRKPTTADLVGVVRHLPNVEEYEVTLMDLPSGERIQTPIMVPPGRYLVVPLGSDDT